MLDLLSFWVGDVNLLPRVVPATELGRMPSKGTTTTALVGARVKDGAADSVFFERNGSIVGVVPEHWELGGGRSLGTL